jgi:DNA polymerase V
MNSPDDFEDGAQLARSEVAPGASVRRTSNAFGSPGTDSTVKRIDLNDVLIRHPEATFTVRASGSEMREAGIDDGDILIVDRSLSAGHGCVVIAVVNGALMCRRLAKGSGGPSLTADARAPAITFTAEAPLEIWGVVSSVIKSLL